MSDTITRPESLVVATNEVPMLEAETATELDANLLRMFSEDLPGFVIRASEVEGEDFSGHFGLVAHMLSALDRISPYMRKNYNDKHEVVFSPSFHRQTEIGRLHTDDIHGAQESYDVHTTELGGGRVMLANAGTNHDDRVWALKLSRDELYPTLLPQLDEGFVDPEIISPDLYTTTVGEGDSVVIRLRNRYGPIIHRFDTSTAERIAIATLIKRYKALYPTVE